MLRENEAFFFGAMGGELCAMSFFDISLYNMGHRLNIACPPRRDDHDFL